MAFYKKKPEDSEEDITLDPQQIAERQVRSAIAQRDESNDPVSPELRVKMSKIFNILGLKEDQKTVNGKLQSAPLGPKVSDEMELERAFKNILPAPTPVGQEYAPSESETPLGPEMSPEMKLKRAFEFDPDPKGLDTPWVPYHPEEDLLHGKLPRINKLIKR